MDGIGKVSISIYTCNEKSIYHFRLAPIIITMDKKVKRQLIQVRRTVKRKLQALKEGLLGQELLLHKQYEPLTKTIRDLKTNITDEIKKELKTENKQNIESPALPDDPQITSTPIKTTRHRSPQIKKSTTETFTNTAAPSSVSFLRLEPIGEIGAEEPTYTEVSSQAVEDAYQLSRQEFLNAVNSPIFEEYLNEFDSLPRTYIEGLIKDDTNQYNSNEFAMRRDKVRYDWKLNKFFIGDSEIDFKGPNLCIRSDLCYRGSVGLYELLFKINSNYPFSIQQKKDYADILKRTNAVYNFRSQTGRGMLQHYNEKPIEFVYFDDINELCERLKLLIASKDAGNTNHDNEIVSILEELRECDIIV